MTKAIFSTQPESVAESEQAREYADYLRRKVAAAHADKLAGRSYSNEDIETEFAALRNEDEPLQRVAV